MSENVCSVNINERQKLFEKFFNKDCFLILNESDSKENIIKKLVDKLQRYEEPSYSKIMLDQIDH